MWSSTASSLSSSTPTSAPPKVRRLEEICASKIAQCVQSNTFAFKSLRGLPGPVLQQVFDKVNQLWTQKWNKSQLLRVLLLFTEPNLAALHLDKTLAHDYLLEAMLEKAATFPAFYSAQFFPSNNSTLHLPIFPALRSISLCISTQTTTRKFLVNFFSACPNLRNLRLAILDDAILQRVFMEADLLSLLPRLENLEVNYQGNSKTHIKRRTSQSNLFLPNSFILDLINKPMNQLTFLSLRDRLLITPTTIKNITLRAPCLTHLILDATEATDSNISTLSRTCRHLKTLSLRECKRLSDLAFDEIGRGFLGSLLHISIAGCRKLTDTTLNHLIEGCPKLRVLDARGCTSNFVHETSLIDVLAGLLHLEVLVLSFNDSKSLEDIPNQSAKKIQVSRRYFDEATRKTITEYYFYHNPTKSSPLPFLPKPCHTIWPSAFWALTL